MKKSLLNEFAEVQLKFSNKREEYVSHLIIGVECDEQGHPMGNMVQAVGSPYQSLGMIEVLMRKLELTKQEILEKLDRQDKELSYTHPDSTIDIMKDIKSNEAEIEKNKTRADELINRLPLEMQEKMRAFKKKMDDAVENRDGAELLRLLKSLKSNPFTDDPNDTDLGGPSEDFNINDFKG